MSQQCPMLAARRQTRYSRPRIVYSFPTSEILMARSVSKSAGSKRSPAKAPAKSASKLPPLRKVVKKAVAKKSVAKKPIVKKVVRKAKAVKKAVAAKKAALKKGAATVTKRVKATVGKVVKAAKKAAAPAKRKGPARRTAKKHTLGQEIKTLASDAVTAAGAAASVVAHVVKSAIPTVESAIGINHEAKK
ncbi:MAG: hypothetical protein JWM57_4270 [Phycisphaerales bacterium]|nr:hypothetical protein [Phycisphaerales bacterium]